jgi:hypothetical protein
MSPNFIISGVARCGTTSLFHYLNQHPEIGMPNLKEPKYFSSLDLILPQKGAGDDTVFSTVVTNESDYDKLFDGLESFKTIGEGSSDCFYYHNTVIPRIKEKLGDVKILVCLRNPVERAYSAYNNLVRDSRETLEFSAGLALEDERIGKNWDWMWHYKSASLYAEALRHYQQEFTHVKVVLFDDLQSNPKDVLDDIFVFLGVNTNISIDVSTKYSHSGKPTSKLIGMLTSRNNKFAYNVRELIIKVIPRSILEKLASKLFKKDVLSQEIRDGLSSYFKNDIEELETLLKKDLTCWK